MGDNLGDSPNLQTVVIYPLLHALSEALAPVDLKHIPQRTPQAIQLQQTENMKTHWILYIWSLME